MKRGRGSTGYGIAVAIAIGVLTCQPAATAAQAVAASSDVVGVYSGREPEIAAGLELRADGRFRYALSYGALDEQAEGHWLFEDGTVLLTGDPVVAPRFVRVGRGQAAATGLAIMLDLPSGMSPQYFTAEVRFADGTTREFQLRDTLTRLPLARSDHPMAVVMTLPLFGIRSAATSLKGTAGMRLHWRFDANDLGKVAFARTPLRRIGDDLVLDRHDRSLRFRRITLPS